MATRDDPQRQARPWWRRLYGLPPSSEQAVAEQTRELRWDRFALLLVAVLVASVVLSVVWHLGVFAGPLGALAGVLAMRSSFFTRSTRR